MLALLVAQNIAFYVIAALIVFGAIRVVTCKNLVHAALWLVLVLGGVAAQYILLAAEFVAITQVLVYLGAIIVLFLFGIMLWALYDQWHDTKIDVIGKNTVQLGQTTNQISDSIFSTYLVPFEVASVLLLAALIGAIVLARRD